MSNVLASLQLILAIRRAARSTGVAEALKNAA
jgi:hypothetical protein